MESQRRKEHVALLSVISNTVLMLLKLAVGLLIGSVSILSEAVHSATDLVAAVIALFSVKTSGRPPDSKHPFGHGKIENISGAIEALLIFVAAIWIIFEAAAKLKHSTPVETIGWGVGVMLFSTVVNIVVSKMLFRVAKETDSMALEADAWHLRTDVYTSAGVMASLALIWVGETILPGRHFYWLDPLAAIAVALLILKAAYDLTVKSGRDLLDSSLPLQEEEWIVKMIKAQKSCIHGFHDLRTRKSGGFRFVEFHIKVDPLMTVQDSHHITDEITARIKEQFQHISVTIHTEPCDGQCEAKCLEGCLLPVKGDVNSKSS
jgi:cation diffusion facilitator family transporter